MTDWQAAPLFDRRQLADLAAMPPHDDVRRLIRGLADELETGPSMVLALVRAGEFAGARRRAHLLRGVALNLGALRIAAVSDAIERGAEDDTAALAGCLPDCAHATRAALHALETAMLA